MKKVLITGSREGYSREDVSRILQEWNKPDEVEFIHGGAPGVDTYAKDFADVYGIKETTVRPVDPTKKKDYILRNFKMVDMCDIVLAFWDGKSPGTKSTVDYAKKVGKNLIEYINLDPEQMTIKQYQKTVSVTESEDSGTQESSIPIVSEGETDTTCESEDSRVQGTKSRRLTDNSNSRERSER